MSVMIQSALSTNPVPCPFRKPTTEHIHTVDAHEKAFAHPGLLPRNLLKSRVSEDEELNFFLESVQRLLVKYTMYNRSANTPVSSGGLQQFITQKLKRKAESSSLSLVQRLKTLYSGTASSCEPSDENSSGDDHSIFHFLPIDLKLHIFSFLDARSLCQACCVNREWSEIACDELMWQRLLCQDINKWSQISHLTNPQMYSEVDSEWSAKEIYLKCSPDFQRQLRQSNTAFNQVSSVLKYLMPKKAPKVAMFGPGLEYSTSAIVRKMIYEDNAMFTRVAMFPGQEGVGGGITLRAASGHSLHLSVLYSASKQERENRDAQERLQHNRLLQRQANPSGGEEGQEPVYELKPQIKYLCKTLDAFIFVVDASEPAASIEEGRGELMAMIGERKQGVQVPLVVLSCVKTCDRQRLPACDIVDLLHLTSLSQPWMVIDCVSDSLSSVDKGILWLVEQAQHR